MPLFSRHYAHYYAIIDRDIFAYYYAMPCHAAIDYYAALRHYYVYYCLRVTLPPLSLFITAPDMPPFRH